MRLFISAMVAATTLSGCNSMQWEHDGISNEVSKLDHLTCYKDAWKEYPPESGQVITGRYSGNSAETVCTTKGDKTTCRNIPGTKGGLLWGEGDANANYRKNEGFLCMDAIDKRYKCTGLPCFTEGKEPTNEEIKQAEDALSANEKQELYERRKRDEEEVKQLEADEAQFVLFYTTEEGLDFYYNPTSIRKITDASRTMWVRTGVPKNDEKHEKRLFAFSCKKLGMVELERTSYNTRFPSSRVSSDRRKIERLEQKIVKVLTFLEPTSVMYTAYKKACEGVY